MSKEVKELADLKEQIPDGQQVTSVNVLFLDVSSNCIGYTICSVDYTTKKSEMTKAGAIWLDPKNDHAEKYNYVFNTLVNWFWVVEKIDHIVVEQYSINPKKMVGVAVVPEMMGVIKCAAQENGVKVSSILPQTWRSILAIKPNITKDASGKNKRDYKAPAKDYVDAIMTVPSTVKSNITRLDRQTPSDLYDAVCISLAWLKRLNFTTDVSTTKINTHIGS